MTAEQIERFASNQARGRALAADHPNGPKRRWAQLRQDVMAGATNEVEPACSIQMLKLIGSALYWGEGSKTSRCTVNFSNSDPAMMRFFTIVCQVPMGKFRGALHIHPHLNAARARRFWSSQSGIPLSQFHRTQIAVSRASTGKRDTLPMGTFRIVISDTKLQTKLRGWINGMRRWVSGGE